MDPGSVDAAPTEAAPQQTALRPRAKQKTPEQKARLEGTFADNPHPNEEIRKGLSAELELTMQEVNAWFQNKRRRMKNKNPDLAAAVAPAAPAASKAATATAPQPVTPVSHSPVHASPGATQGAFAVQDEPMFPNAEEYALVVKAAYALIPGFRSDGPPMGFVFPEPPTSGKAGAVQKRKLDEVIEGSEQGATASKAPRKSVDPIQKKLEEEMKKLKKQQERYEREQAKADGAVRKEGERKAREHERERQRIERETSRLEQERAKAEERRIKQLTKEKERQAKEHARLQARHDKEEEKKRKAAQREAQRQQAKEQKEKDKLDKKKQREIAKRQREAERRTRQTMKLKLREVGPPDDLDIEMAALKKLELQGGDGDEDEDEDALEDALDRPPFPPESITARLLPAFDGCLAERHCEMAGQFLMLWSFLADFSTNIGVHPVSFTALMEAVQAGSLSPTLVNLHIALIRFIQAEAEIANASTQHQIGGERATQANARAASIVLEGHAWGLDLSSWRAHLNHFTWPEVLRQLSLTAGWGPSRCRAARAARTYDDFALGEDVIEGEDGKLTFRWPSRFQPNPSPGEHTMKEACWKVLAAMVSTQADVRQAKEGLPVREITRRIESGQYRNAKSAVTVEGSVAGALSRDQMFAYVAPGTYALHATVAYWRKHKDRLDNPDKPRADDAAAGTATEASTPVARSATPSSQPGNAAKEAETNGAAGEKAGDAAGTSHEGLANGVTELRDADEDDDDDDDDDDEQGQPHVGKAWVEKLLAGEYDGLGLPERLEALTDLMHLALDMPTIRASLDRRIDEMERGKKLLRDEAKVERRNRQLEMAAKAKRDHDEMAARVAALRESMSVNGEEGAAPAAIQDSSAADETPAASAVGDGADGGDGGDPVPPLTAAEAAEQKLRAQLEAVHSSEREATSCAAEVVQRERLGKLLHEMELTYAVRDEPLGFDRRYNRYRWYGPLAGRQTRLLPDRMLFENGETGDMSMLACIEDVEAMRTLLEPKGAREGAFARAIDNHVDDLKAMLGTAPQAIQLPPAASELPAASVAQLEAALFQRLLKVQTAGMAVLGEDGEVRATDYLKDDPPGVKKIKSEMMCVESAIPEQAMMVPEWDRLSWIRSTQGATSLTDLRRLLGELEANLKEDWLCPSFVREPVLVKNAYNPVGREVAVVAPTQHHEPLKLRSADQHHEVMNETLAWLPATQGALAWRLLSLDAAVKYAVDQPPWRQTLRQYRYVQLPALTSDVGNVHTVSGMPLFTTDNLFPPFPNALLPLEAVEFQVDVKALAAETDDSHLRTLVPEGLRSSKPLDGASQVRKPASKKKGKKRVDEDDVIMAADIISSDDDFDGVMGAQYSYAGASNHAYLAPQSTPGVSEVQDDDQPASISESDDDEEDDADFVG